MFASIFWNAQQNRLRAGWRLALHMVLVAIIATVAMSVLSGLMGQFTSPGLNDPVPVLLLAMVATNIGIVGSTCLAARFLDRRKFQSIGLRIDRQWLKDLGFGLALGAGLMTAIFVSCLAAGYIRITGYWQTPATNLPVFAALAINAVTFILVGIHEEVLSRGYQLTNLSEGLSRLGRVGSLVTATLISSAIFGALHLGNDHATILSTVNIAVAGVMLALPYLLTGRLGTSIGLHITWNFFQTCVFGFSVSGLSSMASVIGIQQLDSGWLTGGEFGPEAGLSGLLAMLIGMVAAVMWARRQSKQNQSLPNR